LLRDVSAHQDESTAPTWAREAPAWRDIDRALRSIAKRRAGLDAEEARWIREAEAAQIWKPLGMVNLLDYLERVLGYAPRSGQERLRVARALGQLPVLTDALARGELAFSAVRELTRVATPATEARWVDAARGKNLRQIETLVAGHGPGDHPDDPPDPDVRTHVLRFEVSAETYAIVRQARTALDDEHGTHLDDDALLAAFARRALEPAAADAPSGRATFQIAVTQCRTCKQAWQHGGGATVAIDAGAFARAECDAQHLGALDAPTPERAYQDVSPAVARLVWQRDEHRCRIPGCRSARALEIHHIVHREHGGSHEPSNLILACSMHHAAHHAGKLVIRGTADQLEVYPVGPAHVGAPRAPVGIMIVVA
jgi:hypothetical protein